VILDIRQMRRCVMCARWPMHNAAQAADATFKTKISKRRREIKVAGGAFELTAPGNVTCQDDVIATGWGEPDKAVHRGHRY